MKCRSEHASSLIKDEDGPPYDETDDVRKQDGGAIVGSAAGSRVGRRVVWDWVRENWDAVEAKFGAGECPAD